MEAISSTGKTAAPTTTPTPTIPRLPLLSWRAHKPRSLSLKPLSRSCPVRWLVWRTESSSLKAYTGHQSPRKCLENSCVHRIPDTNATIRSEFLLLMRFPYQAMRFAFLIIVFQPLFVNGIVYGSYQQTEAEAHAGEAWRLVQAGGLV